MNRNPARPLELWVGLLEQEDEGTATFVLVNLPAMRKRIHRAPAGGIVDALEYGDYVLGSMTIGEAEPNEYDCGNVYVVMSSVARRGWGPVLYDSALAYTHAVRAEGLLPDRIMISAAAERLWHQYDVDRSDVGRNSVTGRRCRLYGVPWLDSVYYAREGFPLRQIRSARKRFAEAVGDAVEELPVTGTEIREAVLYAGDRFYDQRADAGGPMRRTMVEGPLIETYRQVRNPQRARITRLLR